MSGARPRSLRALQACAALAVLGLLFPFAPGGPVTVFFAAARTTLVAGVFSAAIGGVLGVLLAGLGLLVGGRAEAAVGRLTEAASALPSVVLLPLFAASTHGSADARLVLALAVVRTAEVAHLVRLEARSLDAEEFILAASALGAPRSRVVLVHMGPYLAPTVLIACAAGAASAVGVETAAAFLGLSPGASGLGAYAAGAFAAGSAAPLALSAGAAGLLVLLLMGAAEDLRGLPTPPSRSPRPLRAGVLPMEAARCADNAVIAGGSAASRATHHVKPAHGAARGLRLARHRLMTASCPSR